MWDANGNYIETKQDKANAKAVEANAKFTKKVKEFLKKHNIKGIAYTYGFSTTDVKSATQKLDYLKIKYRLDYTPQFHTKIIIGKNEI